MNPVLAAVLPPDTPPPAGTELVLFSDPKPYISETLAAQMVGRAARYAKKYGVCLVPQRFLVKSCLCLCLIGPDGKPLGAQRATHLNLEYRELGLSRSVQITPFETPLGRVALLPDVDFCLPHVVRQAARDGAQLLIGSQFVQPYDYFEERLTGAAESAARSNGVPVVGAMGGYGVICSPEGPALCSSFEEVPVAAAVTPAVIPRELRAPMAEALAVLRTHRILFETGGDADAE